MLLLLGSGLVELAIYDRRRMLGEAGSKTYIVYSYDYIRQVREPVGKLVERRMKDRGNNEASLLKLAQKLYPTSSLYEHIGITSDVVSDSQRTTINPPSPTELTFSK